jgi:dihydrofolate reductase|tara:strand:- start:874 stop:1353 length:480 start_codon:yes stop_codon:yes gene_type:complete
MSIKIIAALSTNRIIGKKSQIPWFIRGELKRFKDITMGHNVVMGRKTYESIGKILDGRRNVIITKNKNYKADGAQIVHSFDDAINKCEPNKDIFIIGGAKIYELALDCCDYLLLTLIHKNLTGDTHFPNYDTSVWKLIDETRMYDIENKFSYSFLTYER